MQSYSKEELAPMMTLQNIGPKLATDLCNAGINTPEKLKEMGPEKAYLSIIAANEFCGSFNAVYLYVLYGAIHDIPWQKVSDAKREAFKEFTQELRDNLRM